MSLSLFKPIYQVLYRNLQKLDALELVYEINKWIIIIFGAWKYIHPSSSYQMEK